MPSFNLVDAPWLPCAARGGRTPQLLSLRDVFVEASHLSNIADPSPAVTISLYRLLLAILHRSLDGPRNTREWRTVWELGAWDLNRINRYLDTWHDRFDLFDTQRPFYQTPDLNANSARPATQVTHERASDRNRALLFDHSPDAAVLTPAEAARYLIAQHNFAVGGLISLGAGEPIANKFASSAPLLGGALVLTRGKTLFHTLLLNWVQYSRENEAPFAFKGDDDKPAWEREADARPEQRLPNGYVDLLTWQSRRILLIPDTLPDGEVRVRGVILMKGYQFAESFEQWNAETMVAFRKNTTSKSGPAWFALHLNPDRIVWRDSQALLQSVAAERSRPKTMNWLDTLIGDGSLEEQSILPLEVYGLIPDQANIRDWRRESLPLPLRLLRQDEEVTQKLIERLKEALKLAEDVGRFFDATLIERDSDPHGKLRSPMWLLCEALLSGMSEREPKREDCAILARRFGAGPRYWSQLDAPFRGFIEGVADPRDVTVEYGATLYGMRAMRTWASTVRHIAREVFDGVVTDLDTSARALRASAQAQNRFNYLLDALTVPYRVNPANPAATETEGVRT